ncbi:zinc finger protein 337-like isoform X10 [Aricia agestis]|uniref:zinc finger protein 337-like isoform X10 n=1 Tax=Aricia agestis TaxID=91739 RepID=UPI001C20182C|nr:zinc finger protein 337-like isoform X10 [Aricia agestis]
MEPKTIEWRPGPAVCRCCLAEGCYKDISTEYFWMGKREVYAEMLSETLDLSIAYSTSGGPNSNSRLICEQCISKLRDATEFKRQVQECERTFIQWLDPGNSVADATATEVKLEQVKKEKNHNSDEDDDFNDQPDFGDDDGYDDLDDDVPLTKYASKTPKKEPVDLQDLLDNVKPTTKRKSTTTKDKSTAKKAKVSKEKATSSKPKPEKKKKDLEKDWRRIKEHRGKGPILRENSLKLLENSTVFVFQWNKSNFTCFCCKEPFADIKLLRDHSFREHSLKEIEKKIIQQQNKLLKVEVSLINCKKCDRVLKNLTDLRLHLNTEHGIKFTMEGDLLVPFKIQNNALRCQICLESFNTFRHLNIHVNKHFQNFVCHICGSGFSNLVFLNLHKSRTHRIFQCKLCSVVFKSKREKTNHDSTIHNVASVRKSRFPCPFCKERFNQENFKVLHLVEVHGIKKPEHKCTFCTKIFVTKSLCNNHIKSVHKKERKHECSTCHSVFYTKYDALRHKVTHTGDKNFLCSVCNNSFSTKGSLRRHIHRTHNGSKVCIE